MSSENSRFFLSFFARYVLFVHPGILQYPPIIAMLLIFGDAGTAAIVIEIPECNSIVFRKSGTPFTFLPA
jgi:hypothetical protein